jgi:hypothetical protein
MPESVVWAEVVAGHPKASTSAIRRSRSRESTFGCEIIIQRTTAGTGHCRSGEQSRTAQRGLRGHSRGDRPSPTLRFTRSNLPGSHGREWSEANRRGRTLRNPPSESAGRQGRAIRKPFVGLCSPGAKSGAFTIRPDRICTPTTLTSPLISIATISRSESSSGMGDRSSGSTRQRW